MNGPNTTKNTRTGRDTARATRSARGSVYDFGMISPITTCRIEITTNARTTETVVETPGATWPKSSSSSRETAGSPMAPRASELIVIPSCIAEMKCDGSETILRTTRARLSPCPISSSRRV